MNCNVYDYKLGDEQEVVVFINPLIVLLELPIYFKCSPVDGCYEVQTILFVLHYHSSHAAISGSIEAVITLQPF